MNTDSLNESQRRHLLASIEYVDRLLSEMEQILNTAESNSPFSEYRMDVTAPLRKLAQDYMARIRGQLLRILDGYGIVRADPNVSAIHAMRVRLAYAMNTVTEIGLDYMTGYGKIPKSAGPELDGAMNELNALLQKFDTCLAGGLRQDLGERLEKLEWADDEAGLLRRIERVVSGQGMVEFRPLLHTIVERLENRHFEIAVFGMVNSGKSSLLNHVLQVDVLPVGVNPLTTVPTRLMYRMEPGLTVRFTGGRTEQLEVSRLPEFVTETGNPGNFKGVTRVVVQQPAEKLGNGMLFVDTPGLGSLATSGAVETWAYLPQCDLGMVLINASSTISEEDVATIRVLTEAGVSVAVLLSKADLVDEQERPTVCAYMEEQIRAHLGLALKVHPVSAIGDTSRLLDTWFEAEIAPLYARHQELATASVRRKIAGLRESVEAALQLKLSRLEGSLPPDMEQLKIAEKELRSVAGRIPQTTTACRRVVDQARRLTPTALQNVASRISEHWWRKEEAGPDVVAGAISEAAADRAAQVHGWLSHLVEELAAGLERAAEQLQMTDVPKPAELSSALQGMPRLDMGRDIPSFKGSLLTRIGARLPKARLERQLDHLLGPRVSESLLLYASVLDSWVTDVIGTIQRRFDAHADIYRAQLERLLGSYSATREGTETIRRDIEEIQLRVDEVEDPTSGPSQ